MPTGPKEKLWQCLKVLLRQSGVFKPMQFWNLVLLNPVLNLLLVLGASLHSFGLAVIVLTVIVRVAIMPLTQWQMRTSQRMSETTKSIRPMLDRLNKKYTKDPRKLQQETAKLYKEAGISARGCLFNPMLVSIAIQMPIIIALSRSVRLLGGTTPQDFIGLSEHLYSWSMVNQSLPLSTHFLWLDLAEMDRYFVVPFLVAASFLLSQRMTSEPASDPTRQTVQKVVMIGLPLFFGLIAAMLPSALGLYLVVVSLIGIVNAYYVYGWGNLFRPPSSKPFASQKSQDVDNATY